MTETAKETVRAFALAQGFSACGFTDAAPLPDGPRLAGWLADGRQGAMDYLDRPLEERLDPASFLPGAKSVLVAAWPYPPGPPNPVDWRERLIGRIAAYALGTDYHAALAERMERVAERLRDAYGGTTRVHVDSGPLLEKSLAERAGIGWHGRNTNILLVGKGSFMLLGTVVSDVAIPADAAFSGEHCGDCTACIPACPTGALDQGPTIDARRCVSYLTIEHRGPIEPDLRSETGNWVFGCDDCQTACPWNESEAGAEAESFLLPYLPDLLELDADGFRDRYRHTAVARAKRRGLARNAAVALGNTRNGAAADPLARALREHDEPIVRAHAAWALGRLSDAAALDALRRAAATERIPPVSREILRALDCARSPATD